MTQNQIDYFISVSTTKSIAKSAQKLYVSQSAISKQITLLEKEFGIILFERTNKGVELTKAGALLLDHFTKQNRAFANALKNARILSASHKNQLRIGLLESWLSSPFLYPLVQEFANLEPSSNITIIGDTPAGLLHRLESGELDTVLCVANALVTGPSDSSPKSMLSKDITAIQKVVLYSAKNALAEKKRFIF